MELSVKSKDSRCFKMREMSQADKDNKETSLISPEIQKVKGKKKIFMLII
jgi:hypothetical protein